MKFANTNSYTILVHLTLKGRQWIYFGRSICRYNCRIILNDCGWVVGFKPNYPF